VNTFWADRRTARTVSVSAARATREDFAMAAAESKTKLLLAQLAALLIFGFLVLGAVMYGFSAEVRDRIWQNLLDRPGGPMTFRIVLQPIMAAIAAGLDGVKDAKTGRSPYLWTMLTNPAETGGRLREGVIATARVLLLGLGVDLIYQYIELKTFYPGEAAIVAILLAFVPYLLLRGPAARIARLWIHDAPAKQVR